MGINAVFDALSHPVRRKILALLRGGPMSAGELAGHFDIAKPTLSVTTDSVRSAVRNNGGGHANHSMFWTIMGGKGGAPQGELAAAIERDLGGFATMKANFDKDFLACK